MIGPLWRVVKRNSALVMMLTILAILLSLAVLRRRCESWTPASGGKTSFTTKSHKKKVTRVCEGGKRLEDLQKDDGLAYLAKYDTSLLEKTCNDARKSWEDIKQGRKEKTSVQCKHGECPSPALSLTYPCMNSKKEKCCKIVDGKPRKCRTILEGWRTDDKYIYNCRSKSATCTPNDETLRKKGYCWWGDKSFNKGRCCTRPDGGQCTEAKKNAPEAPPQQAVGGPLPDTPPPFDLSAVDWQIALQQAASGPSL